MTARKRKIPARSARKAISYKDSDTESSDDSEGSTDASASPAIVEKQKVARTRSPKAATTTRNNAIPTKVHKKRHVRTVVPAQTTVEIPSDGVSPDWTSLPYEILFAILKHASIPLRDERFNATSTTTWLLKTAHVCKAFREPALSAFYECPPLLNPMHPHGLLQLLKSEPSALAINYHAKIRKLEFDVRSALAYTAHGKGHINVSDLLDQIPNLSSISITDEKDEAPFQFFILRPKWFYPTSLFQTLMDGPMRLKSWRINGTFIHSSDSRLNQTMIRDTPDNNNTANGIPGQEPSLMLSYATPIWSASLHATVFSDLRSLTLSNLNLDGKHESLISAVSHLRELKEMKIISCQDVAWNLLKEMPQHLHHLDIQDCHLVTSDIIRSYLVGHGRDLQTLILSHNKALDLAFLPILRLHCPALRVLQMDFTYYSQLYVSKDIDPTFDCLLDASDKPTWPSMLQHIELNHLRRWSSNAAETLFGSLIESAEHLPYLRTLKLKAAIDISWRDRAAFVKSGFQDFKKLFCADLDCQIHILLHLELTEHINKDILLSYTTLLNSLTRLRAVAIGLNKLTLTHEEHHKNCS